MQYEQFGQLITPRLASLILESLAGAFAAFTVIFLL